MTNNGDKMSRLTRITRRSRLASGVAAAASVLALLPSVAAAHKATFGSSLDHSPANAGSTCAEDGVMGATMCTHVGSYYPGLSGHAKSPVSGKIVKIKLRAQAPGALHILLVSVRHVSSDHKSGQAKRVVNGPTLHPAGTGGVEAFSVSLTVKKGEELAVNAAENNAEYCADGTPGQLLFSPMLSTAYSSSKGVDGCLMLVQAVVKY
jgi:hypothetical protein